LSASAGGHGAGSGLQGEHGRGEYRREFERREYPAQREIVTALGRTTKEVVRIRISDAGRKALEG